MSLYYDPQANMELSTEGSPDPSWIPITPATAEALGNARKQGAHVYVSLQGVPIAFFPPEKPDLAWNETAHLLPFSLVNGEPNQNWAVTKKSVEEQASLLEQLRWVKQNSGRLYLDPDTQEWVGTFDYAKAGDVYIPTDALTMTTLMGIKSDYERGINVSRDWKISTLNFVTFTNAELSAAYVAGQAFWQSAFTIERRYGDAILADKDVNIYEWSL